MRRGWLAVWAALSACSADIDPGSTFFVPGPEAAETGAAGASQPDPPPSAAPGAAGAFAPPAASEPSPYDTATVCTSDYYWEDEYDGEHEDDGERVADLEGDEEMRPGHACIACHRTHDGPDFTIAGTVFPTAHEPDNCYGVDDSHISVVITGADGAEIELEVNSAGNFFTTRNVALPFNARVIAEGRERHMIPAQTSGDCNGCHTEQGMNGAPGRIMLP